MQYAKGRVLRLVKKVEEWPDGTLRVYFRHPNDKKAIVNLLHKSGKKGYQGIGNPPKVKPGDRICVFFDDGIARYWTLP